MGSWPLWIRRDIVKANLPAVFKGKYEGICVGMTSDVIRTFDTITDLHEVLTEIRGEPAVNRTTTCKQRFGFWF